MSVHYAIKGYFDKEKDQLLLMRNVALFASQRSSQEFNKGWPDPNKEEAKVFEMRSPEYKEWFNKIQAQLKKKNA